MSGRPDAAPRPEADDEAVEVGRVVGAWGIKGWIKVQPHAADPQALLKAPEWRLARPPAPGPAREAAPLPPLLHIASARRHGEFVVAQARELPDRNAAEALKGATVAVARLHFPHAGDGEYYWVDLIGLEVVNRQGERLGRVADLLDTGPHAVLRVRPEGAAAADPEAERMIPFVAAYVDDVSLERRTIQVDWGLDY